jgi:triacylglycerol lipase
MLPLKGFLDANGYRAFIAILPSEDNVENAEYLRSFVTEVEELTNTGSVSVVGFSMGGLSLRHYIRFLGGSSEVSHYVSIDSPQYGQPAACLAPEESGGQMCPFSRFLARLNEGDDTPGDVTYTTILNEQSTPLFGRLRGNPREIMVSGEHTALLVAPEVHAAVLEALRN